MKQLIIFITALLLSNFAYSQTAESYYDQGVKKAAEEDYRGAIADLTKTIELDPKYDEAYYDRGLAKLKIGQKNSGCLDLSKAGELGYEDAYETIKQLCN